MVDEVMVTVRLCKCGKGRSSGHVSVTECSTAGEDDSFIRLGGVLDRWAIESRVSLSTIIGQNMYTSIVGSDLC